MRVSGLSLFVLVAIAALWGFAAASATAEQTLPTNVLQPPQLVELSSTASEEADDESDDKDDGKDDKDDNKDDDKDDKDDDNKDDKDDDKDDKDDGKDDKDDNKDDKDDKDDNKDDDDENDKDDDDDDKSKSGSNKKDVPEEGGDDEEASSMIKDAKAAEKAKTQNPLDKALEAAQKVNEKAAVNKVMVNGVAIQTGDGRLPEVDLPGEAPRTTLSDSEVDALARIIIKEKADDCKNSDDDKCMGLKAKGAAGALATVGPEKAAMKDLLSKAEKVLKSMVDQVKAAEAGGGKKKEDPAKKQQEEVDQALANAAKATAL